MINIFIAISKYIIVILMLLYTFSCFSIFTKQYEREERWVLIRQNLLMFLMQGTCYMTMYFKTGEKKILYFYFAQAIMFLAAILLYTIVYPGVSKLIINNMCMLLCIGLIMITRLNYTEAVKQFFFIIIGVVVGLITPVLIRHMRTLSTWVYPYAIIGFGALLVVALFAVTSGGAKLGFTIAGIGIQPSEFVKITFVFYVAASFSRNSTNFRNVVITTIIAAAHVVILVLSTDLGAALILFVVYLIMLYAATKNFFYAGCGVLAGAGASYIGYHLFSHIKVRVSVWKDPFASYNEGGYQVAQSLFAIGTGGWFGMGLCQGSPELIPVATSDFIFSAISEEMGVVFSICLILICVSCYIMFLNIAMELHNHFYKLVALGLGTCYIFQVFLTIGGVTKFIPSTGVTLPLVSYGGSSLLSTMIMFGVIQGLYIIREDEIFIRNQKRRELARRIREEQDYEQDYDQDYQQGFEEVDPYTDYETGEVNGKKKRRKERFEEVPKQRIR